MKWEVSFLFFVKMDIPARFSESLQVGESHSRPGAIGQVPSCRMLSWRRLRARDPHSASPRHMSRGPRKPSLQHPSQAADGSEGPQPAVSRRKLAKDGCWGHRRTKGAMTAIKACWWGSGRVKPTGRRTGFSQDAGGQGHQDKGGEGSQGREGRGNGTRKYLE